MSNQEVIDLMNENAALKHDIGRLTETNTQLLAQVENMRASLSNAHRALVAFKDAVIASDHFRGREYVGLGIQVNDAIDKARLTLSTPPHVSQPE